MDEEILREQLRLCIEEKLKKAMENDNGQASGSIWTAQFCEEMLKTEDQTNSEKPDNVTMLAELDIEESEFLGIASRPFYAFISKVLARWVNTSVFPFKHQPFPLLKEKDVYFERLDFISEKFSLIAKNWNITANISQELSNSLESLTFRDILNLMGLRHTEGSVLSFPPSLMDCINSFTTLHRPGTPSVLTVGAKAFTKHCHRDQTSNFWGESTGSEANKNMLAMKVLAKILNKAVWTNIHMLPHDVRIYEVRHEEGYGVRWGLVNEKLADGTVQTTLDFRGFLEPQMEDGHSVGWRH